MEGRAVVTIRLSSAVMNPAMLVMATAQKALPPRAAWSRCCFMTFPWQTCWPMDQWTRMPASEGTVCGSAHRHPAARCGLLCGWASGELRVERGDASGQRRLRLAGGVVGEDLVGAGGDAVDGDARDVGRVGLGRVDGPDH